MPPDVAAPEPAHLTPCPSGWRQSTALAGALICDPWPAGGQRTDCAFDAVHLPGTADCVRLGSACAVDGWPADLPPGRALVYVDDDATAGGDGSDRTRAFRSITAAIAAAPDGALIAIATGRYDEDLVVARGLELRGACVDGTRLTSSRPSTTAEELGVIEVHDGSVRNLSIADPARFGLVVRGDATVEEVVIDGAEVEDVWVASGTLTLRGAALRHGRVDADGLFGRGLELGPGSSASVERAAIEDDEDDGVFVDVDGRIELSDVVIARTRPLADGRFGDGLRISRHASATLARVVVTESHDQGIFVDQGAHLVGDDLLVSDTVPRAGPLLGYGLEIFADATVTLHRARFARNSNSSIILADRALLELTDSVVDGTLPLDDGQFGIGLQAMLGAHAVLSRVLLEGNHAAAIFVDMGAVLDASDLVVLRTGTDAHGNYGVGVWFQDDTVGTITRARIEASHVAAIGALWRARVTATDVDVVGVERACFEEGCDPPRGGFGVSAHFGATLEVQRFAIAGAAQCGAVVGEDWMGPTGLDLADGTITGAPIGACVQIPGYDTERLHRRVRFVDVEVPLQATSYALPGGLM